MNEILDSDTAIRQDSITQDSGPTGPDLLLLARELKELSRMSKFQAKRDEHVGVQSAKGYTTLTVCVSQLVIFKPLQCAELSNLKATFLAGMQAQVISLVSNPESSLSFAFLLLGLLITVFGALLCFESSRWFDMLTEKEAAWRERYIAQKHANTTMQSQGESPIDLDPFGDCGHSSRSKNHLERPDFVDVWAVVSIHAGPYLILLGLGCFIVGLLLYIWRTQAFATKIISVIFSILCTALFLPFGMKHNRYKVLKCLALERRSDVGLFPGFPTTPAGKRSQRGNSMLDTKGSLPISSPGTGGKHAASASASTTQC